MYPFKRILIPTDFSLCAEAAYRHGLFLGKHYAAEVHFLHVDTALHDGRPVREKTQGRSDDVWPDRITAPRPGMPAYTEHWHDLLLHRVVLQHKDPVPAILDYAGEHAIDLIVIGAHGDRGTGHFLNRGIGSPFLGRTAEQVIRHAECPVFKVVMQNGGSSPEKVERTLVTVDASALSSLALAYAKGLAALYDARLALLHVIEQPVSRFMRDKNNDTGVEQGEDPRAWARAELIAAFENTRGPTVSASFHVVQGHPERRVRSFVKDHNVHLIVQGAHSDLGRDVLGHIAGEVVRTTPCSVLTVRYMEPGSKERIPVKGTSSMPSTSP